MFFLLCFLYGDDQKSWVLDLDWNYYLDWPTWTVSVVSTLSGAMVVLQCLIYRSVTCSNPWERWSWRPLAPRWAGQSLDS